MLISEAIKTIDKSPENEDGVCLCTLAEQEFEMSTSYTLQDENKRLRSYWLGRNRCTDTWVGYRLYFLEDVFVAISFQPYRKSAETFDWLNHQAWKDVGDYLLSLQGESRDEDHVGELDLNLDLGEFFPIGYAKGVIDKEVVYNGVAVTVVDAPRYIGDYHNFHTVKIAYSDWTTETVDVRDLKTPWRVENGLAKLVLSCGKEETN